jgi:metallo-beta-lactamase class B
MNVIRGNSGDGACLRLAHVARAGLLCALFLAAAGPAFAADPYPPELWTREQAPFRIFGNTWYVGTRGLSAILVVSDRGHVLIDSALPESAPGIAASIEDLGFRVEDVKLIVNSHAHSDHAGGIAELQKASGAAVAASPSGAAALAGGRGGRDDPQFEYGDSFPAVSKVRRVRDGQTLRAGDVAVTVHHTPGHTPGAASWSWESCEGDRCLNMVYADSLNAVSDDNFRFTGDDRYPGVLEEFTRSLATVESLPCDILLAPHPEFTDLWARLERRSAGDADALIDDTACRRYVEAARRRLDLRVEREQAELDQ